jgi:hypothetical protein
MDKQKDDARKFLLPIEKDYMLTDYLKMLTKPELYDIAKRLEVKRISSLSKDQLIETLNNEIKGNISKILYKVTEKEFYFLLLLMSKEGITLINLKDKEQREMVQNLRDWGIVYSGTLRDFGTFAVIPKDIIPEINVIAEDKEAAAKISERQKWVRATTGMLFYYGVIESSSLYEIVKAAINDDIDRSEYIEIVEDYCMYGKLIKKDGNLYYYSNVENPRFIFNTQQEKTGISYYKPDIRQVFQAGVEDYAEWTEIEKDFNDFLLKEYGVSLKHAEKLVYDCIYYIKNNYSINNIINSCNNHLGIDEFESVEINKHIENMYVNTRLWILKGNSQKELFGELGRNDSCACGSGKKYKKCCGNN